jgi:signal peptidase I
VKDWLLFWRRFVAVRVVGDSMAPGLRSGQVLLVRRASLADVRPGQVVVFAPPPDLPAFEGDPPWLVKRVAALPGEVFGSAVVPAGRFAVLGDNASRSYDSRRAGLFTADALLGVMVRVLR